MNGMEIVRQEAGRLTRGMVPLLLIAFGALTLFGYGGVRTAVSLLLGAAYAMGLFWMIGKNAVKAVHFPPETGKRIVQRGFLIRYVLTGAVVFLAIKSPFLNPLAAVLPLFFPKIILLTSSVFQKKGG